MPAAASASLFGQPTPGRIAITFLPSVSVRSIAVWPRIRHPESGLLCGSNESSIPFWMASRFLPSDAFTTSSTSDRRICMIGSERFSEPSPARVKAISASPSASASLQKMMPPASCSDALATLRASAAYCDAWLPSKTLCGLSFCGSCRNTTTPAPLAEPPFSAAVSGA